MSFILQAGGTSNSVNMTAAGTIAAGQPCIVTAAGTAAEVGVTAGGTQLVIQNNLTSPGSTFGGVTYHATPDAYLWVSTTQVRAATYGTVGPIYGTAVSYSAAATSAQIVVFPGTSNFAIVYIDTASTFPTVVIGSVSGSTITLGSPVTLQSSARTSISAVGIDATRALVMFASGAAGTVQTMAISFAGLVPTLGAITNQTVPGSGVLGASPGMLALWHSAQSKGVLSFMTNTGSQFCSVVCTVAALVVTYGTPVNLGSGNLTSGVYDSLRQQMIYSGSFSPSIGQGLWSVSVTGLVPAGVTSVQDAYGTGTGAGPITYDTLNNVIVYAKPGANPAQTFTNSGTVLATASFATYAIGTGCATLTFDSTRSQILGTSGTSAGVAKVGTTNLGTGNYVGIATNSATVGGSVTINTVGNSATLAGLTPGSNYTVSSVGGLVTTTALTLGQYAGVAITSTSLLLKG